VQANKAGILEIADVFAVNKGDLDGAKATAQELMQMIRIGEDLDREASSESEDSESWIPKVELTVATKGEGIGDLVGALDDHYEYMQESGNLATRRAKRFRQEVDIHLASELDALREQLIAARSELLEADSDPYSVADELAIPFRQAVEETIESE
jgi:LAO/AO transport system kinase